MRPFDPKRRAAADASFERGLEAWAAGERKDALRFFRRSLRANPRHAGAWNALARAALQRGRVKDAEDRFLRAVEAARRDFELGASSPRADDPVGRAWLEARRSLALLASRRRLHSVAASELERILDDDPSDALGVRFVLGEEHHRAGALDRAILAYRLAPEEPGARFGLSLALHERGDAADVRPALLRAFVANRYVAPMLLGRPWLPLDGYHATNMAEPEWARAYVDRMGRRWRRTAAALAVLDETWSAVPVRAWRAELDDVAVRMAVGGPDVRSALLDEWVGLITDRAVAAVLDRADLPAGGEDALSR